MSKKNEEVVYDRYLEKIEDIKKSHEVDESGMCGPDPLTAEETEKEFLNLLMQIEKDAHLTSKEKNKLVGLIKTEIKDLYFVLLNKLENNMVNTYEDVINLIAEIHNAQLNGDNKLIQYGNSKPLDYFVTLKCYKRLSFYVEEMESLSLEEKDTLLSNIDEKIENIRNIEKDKINQSISDSKELKEAYEEAKKRFKSLSFFKKLSLNLKRQSPKYQDFDNMDIDEVRKLYK